MNILFINRFLPHATVRDGGGQYKYHTMRSLAEKHEISLITFVQPSNKHGLTEMRALCHKLVAIEFNETKLLGRIQRLILRLLKTRVYGRNISLQYLWQLRRLLRRQRFDVVIIDGEMAWYQFAVGSNKKVLDEIDLYGPVAYHHYQQATGLNRRYLHWDWLRTVSAELHYASQHDAILVRSDKDKTILADLLHHARIQPVYVWFEGLDSLRHLPAQRPAGNKIIFVGAQYLPANVDAAVWFATQAFPIVQRSVPNAEFILVGANPAPEVVALAQHAGVIVTGTVDDLTPYYAQAAVSVVPLAIGGGTIIKLLNSLAAARPAVTTPIGASGVSGAADAHFVVAPRNAQLFAQAVIDLLQNQARWDAFASAGREQVLERYEWGANIGRLEQLLLKITHNSA